MLLEPPKMNSSSGKNAYRLEAFDIFSAFQENKLSVSMFNEAMEAFQASNEVNRRDALSKFGVQNTLKNLTIYACKGWPGRDLPNME